MKLKFLLLTALLFTSTSAFLQTYMKIKPKHFLNIPYGSFEGEPINPTSKIVSYQTVLRAFKFLKDSADIEFRYPQGNCHNRAEIMSRYLEKRGISHLKIWNFAPSKMTFFSNQQLEAKDPNNFSPTGKINWGYHVAPAVRTIVNGKRDTLIIDPSLFKKPVNYREWLSAQHCKASYYTFLNSFYYLFYTVNGMRVSDFEDYDKDCKKGDTAQVPNFLPQIMTGDFYQYDNRAVLKWLEKGLAINEMAYKFYLTELRPILNGNTKKDLVKEYKLLFGSVKNLEAIYLDHSAKCTLDASLLEKHKVLIEKYRQTFYEATHKWSQKVLELY